MQSFRDHERIVEAITDRDEVLAEFLMRRHIASARERFRAAPDREGPEIDEIGLAGFN